MTGERDATQRVKFFHCWTCHWVGDDAEEAAAHRARMGHRTTRTWSEQAKDHRAALAKYPCERCGKTPADGWAFECDKRYCDQDNGPSCYDPWHGITRPDWILPPSGLKV